MASFYRYARDDAHILGQLLLLLRVNNFCVGVIQGKLKLKKACRTGPWGWKAAAIWKYGVSQTHWATFHVSCTISNAPTALTLAHMLMLQSWNYLGNAILTIATHSFKKGSFVAGCVGSLPQEGATSGVVVHVRHLTSVEKLSWNCYSYFKNCSFTDGILFGCVELSMMMK